MYRTTKKRSTSMKPSQGSLGRSQPKRLIASGQIPKRRRTQLKFLIILSAGTMGGSDILAEQDAESTPEAVTDVTYTPKPTAVSMAAEEALELEAAPELEAATDETETVYHDVPLSHDMQDEVFVAADRWGIPAALILAMMDQESDYRTDLISSTGDYGIMETYEALEDGGDTVCH